MAHGELSPLSFEFLGVLSQRFDPIVAGRLIALASLAAVAVLTFEASRRLGATAIGAATGALWLLAVHAGYFHWYVGMNDPQWLGHALGMAGLVLLLLLPGEPSSARLAAVAVLLVAAGFVKHNLLPLPVAITAWLLIERPRAGTRLLVIASLVLASALVACHLRYGAAFLDNVLGMELHRPWSFRDMLMPERVWLRPLMAGAAAVVFLAPRARGPGAARFVVLYAGVSLTWGAFTAGGLGVDVNAFFDLSIAAALALGTAFDSAASRWGWAVPLLVLCAPVLALPERVHSLRTWRATGEAQVREMRDDVARIAATNGPVFCETLALCYWAGKPDDVELFSAELRLRRVPSARDELLARFARHEFGLIQVATPQTISDLIPEADYRWRDGYVASHSCSVAGLVLARAAGDGAVPQGAGL